MFEADEKLGRYANSENGYSEQQNTEKYGKCTIQEKLIVVDPTPRHSAKGFGEIALGKY